jgi:chromosomal replication initiator protein
VVLTADAVPGDLPDLLPRLVGRCRGGVLAQVKPPQIESRKSFLDHFARSRQIVPGTEVRDLLAESLAVGPRELVAALLTLDAASRTARRPIDAALVRRVILSEPTRRPVRLPPLAAAVAKEFGLPVAALRQPDRRQSHVLARQCAMFLARGATDLSLEKIAAYFGRRNHSTVLHACGRIETLLADDPALRATLARVRRTLELPEG